MEYHTIRFYTSQPARSQDCASPHFFSAHLLKIVESEVYVVSASEEICKESEFLTFDSCHVLHSQGEFYAGKTRNSGEIFSNFFDNFYPLTFFRNIVLKTGGK